MWLMQNQTEGYKSQGKERLRLEKRYKSLLREDLRLGELVSYGGNKRIPLLRLYRYKEAFAFEFVRHFIRRFGLTTRDYIFDPFAGMGTTLFASMLQGIPSIGIDKLPIAAFVAKAIHSLLYIENGDLRNTFETLKQKVDAIDPAPVAMDVRIMKLAFDEDILLRLRKWKAAINELPQPLKDIFLLLFFSILEATSYTSKDGQFLRLKREKHLLYPDDAILNKVFQAEQDLEHIRWLFPSWNGFRNCLPKVILGDTMNLGEISFDRPPTAIITSPPYANRYDYTRSYCLELCFHFVRNFEELKAIRFGILRSHIESKVSQQEKPSHPAVQEVIETLKSKHLNNPKIPHMIIGYFIDMEKAIYEWSHTLASGARVAMVVDNVRFEGELIPVDLVLSEVAEEAGFEVKEILIARYKGNSSQQMKRYGRVPVRESIVVWKKQ